MSEPRFQPLGGTANFFNRMMPSAPAPLPPAFQHNTSLSRNPSAGILKPGLRPKQYPSVSSRIKEMDSELEVNLKAMVEDGEVFPH